MSLHLSASRRVLGPVLRVAGAAVRAWDRVAPRRQDLLPALAGGLVGLVPLLVARWLLLRERAPSAGLDDLWKTSHTEVETWALVAFGGACLLRLLNGRLHRLGRVAFHLGCTVLLVATGLELGFFQAMGSRVDLDALAYLMADPQEILPVVMAEVRSWHEVALAAALVVGLLPALPRLRSSPRRLWGRLVLLLLVPSLLIHVLAPPGRPEKRIRTFEDTLVPLLVHSALDRVQEVHVPLPPLQPRLAVAPPTRQPLPNIVMVLLESVSRDATSLGRPPRATTPALADLASRGLVAEHAYTVVPHTSKALVPILCGQYPEMDPRVREATWNGLPDRCLPELLAEAGYRTAFFQTARGTYENRVHLVHDMGFSLFRAEADLKRPPWNRELNPLGIADEAMLDPGVAWSAAQDGPFFVTYLTVVSHGDYDTPDDFPLEPFPEVESRKWRQYLNAVRYVDAFLGALVAAYEARGMGEDTLFVVLGDHGEGFGQHGRHYHDLTIWDEGLEIPLVLYGPGVLEGRSGVVEGNRQTIDIVPTLLDWLGMDVLEGHLPGSSLLGPVPSDRVLYHSCWRSFRCLARRVGASKFIDHYRERDAELFDLQTDPDEQHNRAGSTDPAVVEALRADVRRWRAEVNAAYEARRQGFLAELQAPDDRPALATWDGRVDLLGCTIEKDEVVPGESVWAECHWRAREPLRAAWKVQSSLSGTFETETRVSVPAEGLVPTWRFTPGWAVKDRVRVPAPPDAAPGEAVLTVGWQDFTGNAIPLDGATEDNRFEVGRIRVLPALPQVLPPLEPDPSLTDATDEAQMAPQDPGQ
ncbi:MAG: LTA synthase family protein [Deltaproteobacteria bacterium]|nr:LTA synthase family protein [Deltaproteobacteria bacterium]